MAKTVRLDRLLGNLGYGSRAEIQRLARAGGIELDGADLSDASTRIAVTPDLSARMTVDGRPLDPPPGLAILMHKPLGMTCSRKEDGPLVYDLLPARWLRRDPAISTIGRLDKETSGLLILTDDGDLKREGQRDEAAGKLKDKVDDVKDQVDDAIDKVKDKANK